MTRSKRDRQIDRTRRLEWALYLITFLSAGVAGFLGATPRTMLLLVSLFVGLGMTVWVFQIRAMDEFARLRLIKSLALAGMVTLAGVAGLTLWAAYNGPQISQPRDIPFLAIYTLLVVGTLTASLSNVYLRKQAERE